MHSPLITNSRRISALVPVVVGIGFEMGRVTKGLLHTSSAGFAAVVGLRHTALPSSVVTAEFEDYRKRKVQNLLVTFLQQNHNHSEGEAVYCPPSIVLMETKAALYWGIVCKHLQSEAHALGSDAAATVGTEAEVYAAKASDKNDLQENCWFDCH
ncbi:hypothetical protein KIW84_024212 [Lathyrus oleraceus]|uniref:Uncharacterized protein n=1 Tax=Pisum sativum TaxID=3888 RepID=A0A9D4YH36_PEA|nr:hypothetical protein KIW84_024212 [Pisum sativum]